MIQNVADANGSENNLAANIGQMNLEYQQHKDTVVSRYSATVDSIMSAISLTTANLRQAEKEKTDMLGTFVSNSVLNSRIGFFQETVGDASWIEREKCAPVSLPDFQWLGQYTVQQSRISLFDAESQKSQGSAIDGRNDAIYAEMSTIGHILNGFPSKA